MSKIFLYTPIVKQIIGYYVNKRNHAREIEEAQLSALKTIARELCKIRKALLRLNERDAEVTVL